MLIFYKQTCIQPSFPTRLANSALKFVEVSRISKIQLQVVGSFQPLGINVCSHCAPSCGDVQKCIYQELDQGTKQFLIPYCKTKTYKAFSPRLPIPKSSDSLNKLNALFGGRIKVASVTREAGWLRDQALELDYLKLESQICYFLSGQS